MTTPELELENIQRREVLRGSHRTGCGHQLANAQPRYLPPNALRALRAGRPPSVPLPIDARTSLCRPRIRLVR